MQQSKPSGEKRRICATPVSIGPTPAPPQQQRSRSVASAGASIGLDQPSQPLATQAPMPAGVPAAHTPDEAQKPHDMLAQHSSAAASPGASQEPQGSIRQREAGGVGGLACSVSADGASGGSHLPREQSHAEPAEGASAVQDSGAHLSCIPNAPGLLRLLTGSMSLQSHQPTSAHLTEPDLPTPSWASTNQG